jgi:hypothetical protein
LEEDSAVTYTLERLQVKAIFIGEMGLGYVSCGKCMHETALKISPTEQSRTDEKQEMITRRSKPCSYKEKTPLFMAMSVLAQMSS